MELGVQIYGCMREFRADPEAFCARLKAAGYTQIEPCVALSMDAAALEKSGMNPVWQPEETAGFARLLEKHGLALTSCHVFGDPRGDAEKAADFAAQNHIRQIVVNCLGGGTAEGYLRFAEDCLYLAEKLEAAGTALWIHNGWPEIRAHFDGKTGLELVRPALPLEQIHVPLGGGALDWRSVRAFARANGIPELIDQDVSAGDFLADLADSARLLAGA